MDKSLADGGSSYSSDASVSSKSSKKKPGRKKVPGRLKFSRKKETGKYQKKTVAVADIADCIFSDEEMKIDFLEVEGAGLEQGSTSGTDSASNASDVTCGSDLHSSESISSICESQDLDASQINKGTPVPSSMCESRSSRASTSTPELEAGNLAEGVPTPLTDSAGFCIPSPVRSLDLIDSGLKKFKEALPKNWIAIADSSGFHLVLRSNAAPLAIQREVFVSFGGNVLVYLHCTPVLLFRELFSLDAMELIEFTDHTVEKFCDFCVSLVKKFLQFDVCVGANHMDTRNVWYMIEGTMIDCNPYKEEKYTETCRSLNCLRVVELGRRKRCSECTKVMKTITQRRNSLLSATADPTTKNQYLTREQALRKIELQQLEKRKQAKQIDWLKKRVKEMVEKEGVNIDEDLSKTFTGILMEAENITDVQKWFLQEQWTASSKSDARAHRWHPSMIRLALHLQMVSTAGYRALREAGVLQLPGERTLFNYSHAIESKEGINGGLVKLVCSSVKSFEGEHKKYTVVLCDGMHISQNLVFRKSDGNLVGYTHLDRVEQEMNNFKNYVEGKAPIAAEPQLATEVLAYMVKGIATDVKCVIASFPCKVLTKETLYLRTWEVIRVLEKAGVKVLAFVCDGYPVNRAFFAMHTPISQGTNFGVIFDTVNIASPDLRPLFFISDVCHLIKTLRNAFYNSGDGEKKPRRLFINDEYIEWKTIVRLYFAYKNHTFRKSFKLNSQNVFPTPFSKMRVRYAAQVLSNTVATDLESQQWKGTSETIKFIRLCDKFFDCLNGAHSSQEKRSLKKDLAPYTCENVDDERFVWLKDEFLKYFVDWKKQVSQKPILASQKEKMLIPQSTMEGLEISIRGIEEATKYFLTKGQGKFIMARVFSQDPLEQHFSQQRQGGGGSRNPNYAQFQSKQVSTAVQRGLGVKLKRGNVTAEGKLSMTITEEPLPKRRSVRKKVTDIDGSGSSK